MSEEIEEVVETSEEAEAQEEVETSEPTVKREDKRIKSLSGKVETTAKQRDEAIALAEAAKREAEFYKNFAGTIAKQPSAAEHQDEIKEKVLKGYTVEDATNAVLVREGKYMPETRPVESPAGGSSVSQPTKGTKPVSEMTQEERLEALRAAEARGELGLN